MTTLKREAIPVALIILAFALAFVVSDPAYYGVPLIVAHWLGLGLGAIAVVLRFMPAPQLPAESAAQVLASVPPELPVPAPAPSEPGPTAAQGVQTPSV